MAEKRQNYCQLLGLNPLKESTYSTEAILKKIDTKKGKWANDSRNKQNDTEQRFKSERLVEMTSDMERVMKDPVLKRKEFSDAQSILKGKVQKLRMDCIILSDGSYIALPGAADSYTKKLHWEGVTKSDVLKLAGIKEGNPPKPASDKVLNAYKGLRAVDVYTPIEMLNTLIGHPNLEINIDPLTEGSSYSQIRSAFDVCDKRVNSVRPDVLPEQDSYIQSMRSVKLVLEPDKELATLIAYGKCNRALVPVMETIEQEYTTQLTRKYIDELMNAHLTKDIDSKMAIQILQSFCHKKKIAANFSDAESTMIRCPECGLMVQAGPNTVFCPSCGKNFKTVCPACGTAQQSKNVICIKCGFNFKEGMEKANRLALDFRMNMQKGKIGKAEKSLTQLKDVYSGFNGIAGMDLELQKAKTNLSTMRKLILDSYNKGKFAEAKAACESMVDQFPDALADDLELKQKYGDCVTRHKAAEMYCQKAAVADSKSQKMALYVAAVEICPDHPVAKAKLRDDPPLGPADAIGKLGDRSFTIKFEAPPDASGITYCIYREKNSLPKITEETRPLAEVPGTVYVDKTLEPGVEYYYSIYSKRWGILSKEGAHIGPVMTISEVDAVTLEPIDGGLRIMYEKPRGATRVRLWRTDGTGSGIGTGQTVYDDMGLVGGRKYHYLFVAEYEGRNKVERSQGVVFSGTTVDAPKPVKDMKIKWNKADEEDHHPGQHGQDGRHRVLDEAHRAHHGVLRRYALLAPGRLRAVHLPHHPPRQGGYQGDGDAGRQPQALQGRREDNQQQGLHNHHGLARRRRGGEAGHLQRGGPRTRRHRRRDQDSQARGVHGREADPYPHGALRQEVHQHLRALQGQRRDDRLPRHSGGRLLRRVQEGQVHRQGREGRHEDGVLHRPRRDRDTAHNRGAGGRGDPAQEERRGGHMEVPQPGGHRPG